MVFYVYCFRNKLHCTCNGMVMSMMETTMKTTTAKRGVLQPSLRTMLVVPYVVLIAVLAAIIGLISYQSSRDAIDTWSEQLLIETVERVRQAVDRHVAGSAAVLEVAFPDGLAAPASIMDGLDELRTTERAGGEHQQGGNV